MNWKTLAIAMSILAVYEELATGGAKAEADKLLAIAIAAMGVTSPPPAP